MPIRVLLLLLLGSGASCAPHSISPSPPPSKAPTVALVGGQWFDGRGFEPKTLCVAGEVFSECMPARADTVVDLRGGYVVPPFGDAHTHNLDGAFNLEDVRDTYLREGTFYVQVLANSRRRAASVREQFNLPGTLDVAYAHGGLTSTLSHPFLAYEPRAMGIWNAWDSTVWAQRGEEIRASRRLENDAYWFIDSAADLISKWPQILLGEPDVLKVFLLDAENRRGREGDPLDGPGLDPSLLPEIVERAHQADLRVAAHVETARDAEIAIRAGVDLLAHLPGYALGRGENHGRYEITESVARLAGRQGVAVTPTVWLAARGAEGDSAHLERIRDLQRRNLQLLERHGVKIAVGSDQYGSTARNEVEFLERLGLWSHRELLKMWQRPPRV